MLLAIAASRFETGVAPPLKPRPAVGHQRLVIQAIDVRGGGHQPGADQLLEAGFGQAFDVRPRARAPLDQPPQALRRASLAVLAHHDLGLADDRERSAARRAGRRRVDNLLAAVALGAVHDAGHERDHVAAAEDVDAVADADVARRDHRQVVQADVLDVRPGYEHPLDVPARRQLAGLARRPIDSQQPRHGDLRRRLECDRARGVMPGLPGGVVDRAVGELDHDAVELVVNLPAAVEDPLDVGADLAGISRLRVALDGEPSSVSSSASLRCASRSPRRIRSNA